MQNISKLLKLEFMMDRSLAEKRKRKIVSQVLSYLLIIAFSTLFSLFFVVAFKIMGNEELVVGQLSLIFLILTIILFFFSLSLLLKRVFLFKKKETLSYIPVKKSEIYFAKLIYCFVKVEFLNIILTLPAVVSFLIVYGFAVEFYFIAVALLLIVPLFPFAVANLVLIPTMYVLNFFKDKHILSLILTIAIVLVLFYFYMQFVFSIAEILLLQKGIVENLLERVIEFCENKYLPTCLLACVILKLSPIKNLLIYFAVSIVILIVSILILAKSYNAIFVSSLSKKTSARIIKTKSKKRNSFTAYFVLEIKELFRNSSMLFTYVGMAVAMPFMVVYCNKFIIDFAVEQIGTSIIAGTVLFVILLFVSIICSPVSLFISKEGDRFWILKTNPNGIKIPLFAKSLVGIFFSSSSLIATLLTVCLLGHISWTFGAIIFAIALIYIIALVSIGLICNLKMPNVFYAEKENTSNMLIMLLFGFLMSSGIGVFAIIKSFTMEISAILNICLAIVSAVAIISIVILFTQYKRYYAKMEAWKWKN